MVIRTNNYARMLKELFTAQLSRMTRWKDVSREELKTFFVVIIYMGLNPKPSNEHYWKLYVLYYNPLMHSGPTKFIPAFRISDKPGSTVVQLTEPLLDAGRIIVADNYYTTSPLAEYLKGRNTHLCGKIKEICQKKW
ncbi:unnamed protein product [Arctia plantaginis]|uniref:PiggyBac transposable element-derived protein domain-containing protein n=1 Tax=Arctia plantaginis TaxID=874455 RepID=A0A8S0ZFP8_ARCPL|nr:unnamed protein product [Arctia plantaginis]CAB3252415.1 unnamed protein product [Arctia plantaginis]